MTERILDDETVIGSLSLGDRSALAYMVAAQILRDHTPDWEYVPLLGEQEHTLLVEGVQRIATDLADAAGPRGIELLRATQ